jgi:hypothetical protein
VDATAFIVLSYQVSVESAVAKQPVVEPGREPAAALLDKRKVRILAIDADGVDSQQGVRG